jgi:hypothetical protein
VTAFDTRDPKNFTFGGYYPPPLSEWQAKGWQVVRQIEEPLADTGMALLEWCQRAPAVDGPDPILWPTDAWVIKNLAEIRHFLSSIGGEMDEGRQVRLRKLIWDLNKTKNLYH